MASGREWTCPQLQACADTTALEPPRPPHAPHTHSEAGFFPGDQGWRTVSRFRRAARLLLDDQKGSGDSALWGELSEHLSWFFSPREPLREGEW